MFHRAWLRVLGLSLCLSAIGLPAPAGELFPPGAPAPSMKRLDQIDPGVCIESLPHTITSPGRYTLCGDLTAVPGQSGITVLASDVTIDGGGFVLQGVPGSLDGIFVEGEQENIVIRSLIVRGFGGNGVHAPSSTVTCSSVVSSSNVGSGFVLNLAVLEDCVGNDNGGDGCDINAYREFKGHVTLMKRCDFSGNTGAGLRCADGAGLDCESVRCDSNGQEGLSITGADGHVTVLKACASNGNGGSGLFVTGTERLVCEDSTFRDNDSDNDGFGDGIDIVGKTGHVTVLKRCDSSGNGGSGLRVSGADLVTCEDSIFHGNGGDGMRSNGKHFKDIILVVRCHASDNVGSGLHLTDISGDCDDSRFVGNGGNGITTTVSVADTSVFGFNPREISVSRCDLSSNVGHGLHASTLADETSLRVALSSSSLSGNGAAGCRVECPNSSVSASVHLNECLMDRNAGSGLHVTRGPDFDAQGRVENCVVRNNGSHGVQVEAASYSGVSIWKVEEGTFIHDNNGDGFRFGGGGGAGKVSLQDFHFSNNDGHGLHIITGGSDGGDGLPPSSLEVFAHNGRLLDNTGDGLHMAQGSGGGAGKVSMQDMHFSRNGGSGADVSSPATVEGCSFTDNLGPGMTAKHTRTGHVTLMKRVVSTGNGGSGISVECVDGGPTSLELHLDDAVVSNNGGHGVSVDGGTSAEFVSLNFTKISMTYNEQSGARVSGGSYVAPCDASFTACDSSNNGGHGFDITGSTGGGGLPGGALTVTALHGSASGNLENGINIGSASSGGGAGKATFKEFTITRNTGHGLRTNCPSTIEDCDSSLNGLDGFLVQGRREFKGHVTLMKRVVSSGNGGNGIVFDTEDVDAVMDLHVESSVSSNNGGNGLHLTVREPTAVVALACTSFSATNNDLHGMLIAPVAMDKGLRFSSRSSSFSSNGETGITVTAEGIESCIISSSEACDNGSSGMILVCDVVHLEGNTVSSNSGNGISLSSSQGGVVRDNTCSSNTERGITINTSHVEYASNRCVSNGVGGIDVAGGFGNVLHRNFVSGNTGYGIQLESSENRLYENSNGVQVNPLYSPNPGVFNDTAPLQPAAVGGASNIGS